MSHPLFRDGLFEGKVFLVTGGGSGIGLATAQEIVSLGGKVHICGRTEDKLQAAGEKVNCSYSICDVRNEDAVIQMVESCLEKHGRIDGLVNNAGGQFPSPTKDISLNGWESVVKNNLTSTFLVSREVLNRAFIKGGGGTIVNIVAENKNGMPMMAHSGAARAGVENFTKSAAWEWARYKVRINSLAPGIVATSGLETYPEEFRNILKTLKPRIPMKRFATTNEIVSMILYLLSPASCYITGSHFRVDGGLNLCGPMMPLGDYEESPSWS